MTEQSRDDTPAPEPEPAEDDWAEEIKRLRAAQGAEVAARLAEESDKEPPVA